MLLESGCDRRCTDSRIVSQNVPNILRTVVGACAGESSGQERCFVTVMNTTGFEEGAQAGQMGAATAGHTYWSGQRGKTRF